MSIGLTWVRNLAVPFEWQSAVVRAAITLKLCSFMETGAIVAAHTTSIPEAPSSTRNWDYRYCWLRDAYFVVDALNRLGATQTMESYINYITTIATDRQGHAAGAQHRAVFLARGDDRARSQRLSRLTVRSASAIRPRSQTQNDVYGSVVLAATQMFVDERLPRMGDEPLFRRLELLGESALARAFEPDAGLWEYRDALASPHLFRDAVLGGLRPAGRHRAPAQHRRPRQILGDPTPSSFASGFWPKPGTKSAAR